MKKSPTIFVLGFVLLAGLVLIPFVGVQGQAFRWQNYAGVYETPTPGPGGASLVIDFYTGAPGSFFTITGFGYFPETNATVRINGQTLGNIPADSNGELQFFLNTSIADEGHYEVTVEQGASTVTASTQFYLTSDAEQHPLTGSGTIFNVPQGIAVIKAFLPVINR